MLNNFCLKIIQNKNLVMFVSVVIYIMALFSTLSGHLLGFSLFFTILFIVLLLKNLFPIKYIVIWTLLFYLGVINTSFRLKDVDELLSLAPVNSEITGTIITIPKGKTELKPKFFFDVKKIKFGNVEKELFNEQVLVTMADDSQVEKLKLYNTGTLTGRLSMPFKAGNPSQFDYGNYLRNFNTYAVFYAKDFTLLENDLGFKASIFRKINDYREDILSIHSKYLKSPNLEILGGIVFGDDAVSSPKEIKQSFVNSGLLHILAASGMNVAFIYGFFFWIVSLFKVNFRFNVILGMLMVVVYTLMTGLGASVIRASCMLLFVLAGKLIDRDANSISLLAFVGLLMLIYNPLYINDVGFQLSFIVTFGILLTTPAIIQLNNKFLDFLVGTITIPIIAQLWVIPIQIFYFNNISLYSVFANIMSVPILMVLSFGGFISSLFCLIKPLANWICNIFDMILNPLINVLVNISEFWGNLPNSALQTTHPNVFQILLYYVVLLLITGFLYKEVREKYSKPLFKYIAVLVFVLLVTLIPVKNKDLEIITFDVGNADCFLIKTPKNEFIMIDSGKSGYNGGKSQAEIIVLKYFKDKGIKNIDAFIISHFDTDHCGGAVDIIKNLNVKKVYVNDLNHNSVSAKELYKVSNENNVKIILAENNQQVFSEKSLVLINFLGKNTDNDNENSIITLLEYKDFNMLFTGDVSAKGLNDVINQLPDNLTVLKVPHHGALGGLDKRILEKLKPKYSIISVGENKFGHPSLYTLEILKNSKILRTDIDNSILIKTNGEENKFYTYDSKKRKYALRREY